MMTSDLSAQKKKVFKCLFSPLIVVGAVFLLNPNVKIFDILPDFIGYICFYFALDELKRLNGHIEYAAKYLIYLIGISAAKFAAMFFIALYDSSLMLTVTFSFGAVEFFVWYLFIKELFEGLYYMLQRGGGDGELPDTSDAKFLSVVFGIVKFGLPVIPELWALIEFEVYSDISASENLHSLLDAKNYVVVLVTFIALIFGIWWFRSFVRFFKKLKSTDAFFETYVVQYTEMYDEYTKSFSPVRFNIAICLICASFLFFIDPKLDGIHFMPEFVGVVLSLLGAALISKYSRLGSFLPCSLFALAASVLSYLYRMFCIDSNAELQQMTVNNVLAAGAVVFVFVVAVSLWAVSLENFIDRTANEVFGDKDI